jgi:hypothetical protein
VKKPEEKLPQDPNLRVRLLENSIQIALDNLRALKHDERFQNFLTKSCVYGSTGVRASQSAQPAAAQQHRASEGWSGKRKTQ